jgi:hypothetical protein
VTPMNLQTGRPTRRIFIAGVGLALISVPAWGAEFSYKDWRFNTDALNGPLPTALVQSLQAQVDIVESLNIKPEIKTFFRSVPLEIDLTTRGGPGAYSFQKHRMFLSAQIDPPENPVFLHELLHAYHDQKLPDGFRNAKVIDYYEQAKRSGLFPADSYMLKNKAEFFAMGASVMLWGRAARPPSTRANVKAKMPDFYDWVVQEFGAVFT